MTDHAPAPLLFWKWINGWHDTSLAVGPLGDPCPPERAIAEHQVHVFELADLPAKETFHEQQSVQRELRAGAMPICGKDLWGSGRARWSLFETGGDPRRLVPIAGHKVDVCKTCETVKKEREHVDE